MKDITISTPPDDTLCEHCTKLISENEIKSESYCAHRTNDHTRYFHQDCFMDWMRIHYNM